MNDASRWGLIGTGVAVLVLAGLWVGTRAGASGPDADAGVPADTVPLVETTEVTPATDGVAGTPDGPAVAVFAGGCFWCMEPPFDRLDGVLSTVSGYAGGEVENPTYEEVSAGRTRHREAIRVTYDPTRVSYTRLLEVFWHNVDPTDSGGQFCDRGFQYTTAIFPRNDEQEELARDSKERLAASGALGEAIDTPVLPSEPFYEAEEYHQDFYRKNPARYESYREGCGRDRVLEALWGDAAGH